jgi:DNA-binding response OmpR family regulator
MSSKIPLSVVIADDNRDHAESLATLVTLWGHEVYVCLETESALDFYQRFWPDVMLLDIGLPLRSDGLALAKKARQLTQYKISTIIAVTGFADDETMSLAKEAGFDYFFVKPIDHDRLETLLNMLHQQVSK